MSNDSWTVCRSCPLSLIVKRLSEWEDTAAYTAGGGRKNFRLFGRWLFGGWLFEKIFSTSNYCFQNSNSCISKRATWSSCRKITPSSSEKLIFWVRYCQHFFGIKAVSHFKGDYYHPIVCLWKTFSLFSLRMASNTSTKHLQAPSLAEFWGSWKNSWDQFYTLYLWNPQGSRTQKSSSQATECTTN